MLLSIGMVLSMQLLEQFSKLAELGITYYTSDVHLFYGHGGSGKTHFAVYFPILMLYKELYDASMIGSNTRFIVIAHDDSYSIKRMRELATANGIDYNKLREHITIFKPYDILQLLETVNNIGKLVKQHNYDVKFIAVDGINNAYVREMLTIQDQQAFIRYARENVGIIKAVIDRLKLYATKFDCIVTVTAHKKKTRRDQIPKKWYEEVYAGGVMQYAPSLVVRLEKVVTGSNKVKVKVVKARHTGEGGEIVVEFTEQGFKV